jgi:hypothetical protein
MQIAPVKQAIAERYFECLSLLVRCVFLFVHVVCLRKQRNGEGGRKVTAKGGRGRERGG